MKMYGNAKMSGEIKNAKFGTTTENQTRTLMDSQTTYYVVRVNGQNVSMRYTNKMMAEQELINLPDDQRMVAEIVAVTDDGKQVLLG